jgi:hypothetical protein
MPHDSPYPHPHQHQLFPVEDLDDPWRRLPAIADRLGVRPINLAAGAKPRGTVAISTRDGHYYDLFDLIDALLDKMDKNTHHH